MICYIPIMSRVIVAIIILAVVSDVALISRMFRSPAHSLPAPKKMQPALARAEAQEHVLKLGFRAKCKWNEAAEGQRQAIRTSTIIPKLFILLAKVCPNHF